MSDNTHHDNTQILPRSSVPGIAWPALPGARAANMLAIQYQLEQSQWWTTEKLERLQFRQLQPLLAHAYNTTSHYRDSLEKLGFQPGKPITTEQWKTLPILTRSHIQEVPETLHSGQPPKQHGPVAVTRTSGSTGKPIAILSAALSTTFWQAFTLREHLWHQRDFNGKLAVIRHMSPGKADAPEGRDIKGWGPSTNTIFSTGPSAALTIESTLDEQLSWLQKQNPDYLLTYPTNVRALAEMAIEQNIVLPNLKEVRTISEVLDTETRILIEKAWGVKTTDIYSANELGYIALQCPDHEHYHIQSEGLIVEILNPAGESCKPGETGRVVVTDLHNYAMPLIRYEVGDYAEVGEPCPCGRGLPIINRILGRSRNMIALPNGKRHWLRFNHSSFEEITPIRQYQIIQHDLEQVEVKLVTPEKMNDTQEQEFAALLQHALGHPFTILFTYVDHIPRSKGGKYEDIISHVV